MDSHTYLAGNLKCTLEINTMDNPINLISPPVKIKNTHFTFLRVHFLLLEAAEYNCTANKLLLTTYGLYDHLFTKVNKSE